MNNEEQLKQEAIAKYKTGSYPQSHPDHYAFIHGYLASAEPREKRIAELEEKISVLLSCKNCPENKGGLLCQKEYEDKCLAQKIQYIKELQEEFKNLKKTYRKQRNKRIDDLQKENAELRTRLEALEGQTPWKDIKDKSEVIGQLTKAKEIIKDQKELLDRVLSGAETLSDFAQNTLHETEQFLKEVEQWKR